MKELTTHYVPLQSILPDRSIPARTIRRRTSQFKKIRIGDLILVQKADAIAFLRALAG